MREALDAPVLELPPETVEEIRSFLDGQSRIELAVWVRHTQQGVEGTMYDHHLVLAVADDDWAGGDMRALDEGLELPPLGTREPTWIDIYPLSEVEALRSFGTVLWKRTSAGRDPLDYRLTYEPLAADAAARERFAARIAAQPAIRSVGATVEKLWKDADIVRETAQVIVDAPFPADVLSFAMEAARETILDGWSFTSGTIGRPSGDGTTILYEAAG